MSNWFVSFFFVLLGIAGMLGLFAALAGVWDLAWLMLGFLPAGWYSKRYRGTDPDEW